MNNTNLHFISHRFPVIAQCVCVSIIDFDRRWLSLTHSFWVISSNIAKNHIVKTTFSGLHFYRRQYGSSFNQFDLICFKS